MSHSRVFDEYAKIMSDKGLVKAADKKDEDYNIVPDKAGPDTKVDKSGYELVEIAHPEQIQVAESRLNDGIVENGVEQQKAMMDVALRNPRGVLAAVLMKTLVKAANTLDKEMSNESIRMATEIDSLITKLAQQNFYSADAEFETMKAALGGIIDTFPNLNYGFFGMGGKDTKAAIDRFTSEVRRYANMAKGVQAPQKKQWTAEAAAFIRANEKRMSEFLADAKDDVAFVGTSHKDAAMRAWNDAVATANGVAAIEDKPQPAAQPASEQHKQNFQTIPKEQSGAASKAPHAAHNYSVYTPEVKELQGLLGVTQDSKFGPNTFAALSAAAKNNSLLAQLMDSMPKGYQGWKNENIGEAVNRLKTGKASAEQAQSPQKQPNEQHFTASGLGIPYENEK
jgi:hypothetical protein